MMLSKFYNDTKLKAGVWLRERREKAEERKAAKRIDPPGVTVPEWLVRAAHFAGWIAYAALMYFLWERVLDVSRAQHSALEVTHFGIWSNLNLAIFFPLIVGYVFVVIGVPYVAKIAIPILVSLSWRDNFWPKLTALVITLLVSVVLITGTATVGSNAIIESERGAAVAVEQVEQSRAVLQSRIAAADAELARLQNHPNTYFAIAASMTPETYRRTYIEARRDDPQYTRFLSALGASEDAAALRQRISELRDQMAASQTTAAVSSEVITDRTQTLNSVMDFLNTFWVLMLAVVMDLACLFMPWIALRLEQQRNRQMGMAGGIPQHPWMLTDQHESTRANRDPQRRAARDVAEAMVAGGAAPRFAADMARAAANAGFTQEELRDAHTKEIIVDKDGDLAIKVKEHTRKLKKEGKAVRMSEPVQITIPPGPTPPDETGVETDGGGRQASVSGDAPPLPVHEETENVQEIERHESEQQGGDDTAPVEQPAPSGGEEIVIFDDETELEAAPEVAVDSPDADEQHEQSGEPDQQSEHVEPREEPETREDRLIASVAAE